MMINTWTMRSVAVALAGLALAVGASRSQGQEVKEEAAKAPAAVRAAASLTLAKDGKTEYAIVTAAAPRIAEQTAAKELAEYLKKVTGAEFKSVAESATEPKPAKAIYLGWTTFAASQGIDCAKLGVEESVIKTVGSDLVITGGRPRGTIYGVYDFLQKELGVYWLDRDTEVVPKRPTLALNAIDRRAVPAFKVRFLDTWWWWYTTARYSFTWDKAVSEKETAFISRNRQNSDGWTDCHNLALYVPRDKVAEHPEYYALDKDGKTRKATDVGDREKWTSKGGLCLTHPEVRKIVLAALLEKIAADRKTVNPNQPPPDIYSISQMDNDVVCHCPGCRALVAREGSESGPLIDFVNEIADGVRGEYPEVKVQTEAYWWSLMPPKTIRPRDNVVIRWCDWMAFHLKQCYPEPWFPLTAPANAERAELVRRWSAITPAGLMIFDYGESYTWPGFPFTCAATLADDLRFFADNRVVGVYNASLVSLPWEIKSWILPFHRGAVGQFSPLFNWLAMQLMIDPRQPVEPLLATFMAGYYGPAAPTMRALYDKLVAAQRALPTAMESQLNILKIDYVTPAFYAEVDALLQKAEAACAPDSLDLWHVWHVQYERIRCDSSLLFNWDKLQKKLAPSVAMPFDREAVLARLETRAKPVMTALGYPEKLIEDGTQYAFGKGLDKFTAEWRGAAKRDAATESAKPTPVGPELSQAPVSGRYVRLEHPDRFLSIAEVQVFSAGVNVALRKSASMLGKNYSWTAERAVDGITAEEWRGGLAERQCSTGRDGTTNHAAAADRGSVATFCSSKPLARRWPDRSVPPPTGFRSRGTPSTVDPDRGG